MTEVTILKLGGSLITYKDSNEPKLNKLVLNRLCEEIKESFNKKSLIIVHGAGSFGHPLSKKYKLNENFDFENKIIKFAELQILQNKLNFNVCENLIKHEIPAYPFQVSTFVYSNNGDIKEFKTTLIEKLVNKGIVPVLYGTPTFDIKKGSNVFSGDDIILNLVKNIKLKIKNVIFATDVDGIFDKDPKKHGDAKLIKKINSLEGLSLTGSMNNDVTGGMKNKIEKLFDFNVTFRVINGNKSNELKKAINNENVGTVVNSKN